MFSRHRQRGDVHGDAAIHVERPDQEETAPAHDGPEETNTGLTSVSHTDVSVSASAQLLVLLVFEEQPLDEPQSDQDQPVDLGDGEGPRHSVHVVEELVGQRRAHGLVRHPLVDDGDHNGGEDEVEQGVEEGHARLPPLLGKPVRPLLRHGDLHVVAVFPQPAAQRVDQLVLLEDAAQFAALLMLFAAVRISGGRWRRGEAGWVTVSNPRRMRR